MPWLLNEDSALKFALQGIMVTDANAPPGGRPVKVRFRSPEDEVAKYTPPLILIEMPRLSMAFDRMHDGLTRLPYAPEGYPPWWPGNATSYDPDASPYLADFPIAYDITYQLTVYTRINRDHMMPIMAALEAESMLGRYAVLNIPQDGTYRRITRLGGPDRDYSKDELGKRLFRATYVIRVPTELVTVPPPLPPATDIITSVSVGNNFDYSPYYNDSDLLGSEVLSSFGVLSARAGVQWDSLSPAQG
jgi:hypothetical protein